MRVLIAPDKFKGSLSAVQACDALSAGLKQGGVPSIEIDCCPIADGGEGTVDAAIAAGFAPIEITVDGPTGQPVQAAYARRGDTAVVELAAASGLQRLPTGQPAALTASSRGTGQLLAAALNAGARSIILGIGGSASTDGGAGLLDALGAKLTDRHGRQLTAGAQHCESSMILTSATSIRRCLPPRSSSLATWRTLCWAPPERPPSTRPRRAPRRMRSMPSRPD